MSDLRWMTLVADYCESRRLDATDTLSAWRSDAAETYVLAHRQWLGGASRRVVSLLLDRACREAGLDDDG